MLQNRSVTVYVLQVDIQMQTGVLGVVRVTSQWMQRQRVVQ